MQPYEPYRPPADGDGKVGAPVAWETPLRGRAIALVLVVIGLGILYLGDWAHRRFDLPAGLGLYSFLLYVGAMALVTWIVRLRRAVAGRNRGRE